MSRKPRSEPPGRTSVSYPLRVHRRRARWADDRLTASQERDLVESWPTRAASRVEIDKALDAAGWVIQDRAETNLTAGLGVAVREFKMADGHGFADYMLFVEGKAVGVLEAKPAGYPGSNSCQAAPTNPRNSMFNAGGVPKGSQLEPTPGLAESNGCTADRRYSTSLLVEPLSAG